MKKMLLALCLTISLTATAQTKDEQKILAKLDAQAQSWNTGNINEFMKAYWNSDSLMFISNNGITYGYHSTLEGYHKRYPDRDAMGQLTFTILKLNRISGNSYFVAGKWFLKREKKGDVGGYFTLLWKKINDQWLIVSDHTS
jgi:hypothetical protein